MLTVITSRCNVTTGVARESLLVPVIGFHVSLHAVLRAVKLGFTRPAQA